MKKLLTFLMVAAVAMTAVATTGCEDGFGDGDIRSAKVDITVYGQDWLWSDDDGAWFARVSGIEELDRAVIEYGIFQAYFCWWDGDVLVQEPVSSTVYWNGGDGPTSETITCDYAVGEVTFYVRSTEIPSPRPKDMDFRLVMMW